MRHGEAGTLSAAIRTDIQRQLTAKGRRQVKAAANQYRRQWLATDEIWASPYVRTRQTAAIIAESVGKPVITRDWLAPDGDLETVLQHLARQHAQQLLLVSHQPLVGDLVNALATLEPACPYMEPAAIVCIDIDASVGGAGVVKWLHRSS